MGLKPTFQIVVAGKDITADVSARLVSLDIVDSVDEYDDTMTMTLSDPDGTLELPSEGARIDVSLGYDGGNQRIGSFIVDEVSVDGPPDMITVTANASPFVNPTDGQAQASFTSHRSRAFEGKTIKEIVETCAGDSGLEAIVDSKLASIEIPYIAQVDESNANLLVRIARRYNGVLKPSDGKLVLAADSGGQSTSGKSLSATISLSNVSHWSFKRGGKNKGVKKVKAKSHNYGTAETEEAEADVEEEGDE
jgi:phage protein D